MSARERFLLPMLALATGCGSDDLPEYSLLDRLRVVAAVVSGAAAEFSPGDAGIQVVFHVSDPAGAGRTLSYSVSGCVDPGVGYGATPTCTGNPTAVSIDAGTFVPGSAATHYYGTFTTAAFAVPAAGVIFIDPLTGGARTTAQQYNGVAYLVVATLTTPTGQSLTAFKRVVVSTKPTKNRNPTFGAPAMLIGGVDAGTATLGTGVTTEARVAASSRETYLSADTVGGFPSATEEITVTWLATAGEFDRSRTDLGETNFYEPAAVRPATTSFLLVVRDDRGGAAVVDFHRP